MLRFKLDKRDPEKAHATRDDGRWQWPESLDRQDSLGPRILHDRTASSLPESIPDVNTYQQKKNLAQGMMDLALFTANANQLRYVLECSAAGHPYYYSSIIFITLSIFLQVAVGIGLIMNALYNVRDEQDILKADKINNMTVLGIFLITVVNVFISSFSVAPSSTGVSPSRIKIHHSSVSDRESLVL